MDLLNLFIYFILLKKKHYLKENLVPTCDKHHPNPANLEPKENPKYFSHSLESPVEMTIMIHW